jgi:uracil-DNA glycosylase
MPFTDAVIRVLSERRENIVFMLWGRFAQEKAAQVDPGRHLVLRAAHPSPYSADKGFFGCRHFSRANAWLVSKGITPVDWNPESGQS